MRYWNSHRGLLSFTAILVMILSLAVMGCSDDGAGGDDNTVTIAGEEFALTAQNAAALAGQIFTFDDPSIFGDQFADAESATLTLGNEVADGALPFILTINGTTIQGAITFIGSCRLRELPVTEETYNQRFDTCNCIVDAQDVPIGGSTDGTIQLQLGRIDPDTQEVIEETSNEVDATISVDNNGDVKINDGTTPIGKVPTGGTGGTGET